MNNLKQIRKQKTDNAEHVDKATPSRARYVAAVRDRLGLKRGAMANRLGVNRETVRRWENGQRHVCDQVLNHYRLISDGHPAPVSD